QLMLGSLILFFVLLPIASAILFLPQYIELGQKAVMDISFFERARSLFDLSETSIKGRLEIWRRTLDSMVIHPVLGVGIGNFPIVLNESFSTARRGASAHNLYLDFAAEIGVFGALILISLFIQIFKDAWQAFTRLKKYDFRIWAGFFILALIWIFGYSLFDVVLLNDKVLLFFIANLALLYATKSSFGFYKSTRLERSEIH
ncbi:MAG: O-antigen ligase family protein, partial [Patescibacteria group bacterium]